MLEADHAPCIGCSASASDGRRGRAGEGASGRTAGTACTWCTPRPATARRNHRTSVVSLAAWSTEDNRGQQMSTEDMCSGGQSCSLVNRGHVFRLVAHTPSTSIEICGTHTQSHTKCTSIPLSIAPCNPRSCDSRKTACTWPWH
eukprot:552331-Prorocentrum_minimum.AAC.1